MEQKSTPNKRARIHMRRRAVLAVRNHHQPEQLKLNMEIKEDALSTVAVLEVLDKNNYMAWSVRVKTYLMAQDLWEVVEATTEPPKQEDDEAVFKAWSKKNFMALHVLKDSCGLHALSVIKQISSAKIAWNTLAVVLQVLEKDNYVDWSVRVKTYLMAHDLWDIIEGTTEPPNKEDDEAVFKAWSKKNSKALHVIQISCGPDTFSEIIEIISPKIAWDTLAEKFLQVLEEDNYVDWSLRVKNYLMAHDLWDIIEGTTEPPKQEDDEAIFKAWSHKNFMALHEIQISCRPDIFSEIIKMSSAKIAWDTLAEKYNVPTNTNSGSDRNEDYVQYEALIKAVKIGEWNAVEEFLNLKPDAAGAKITSSGATALYIAVCAQHEHIVENLVDIMSVEDLAIQDCYGNTALSTAINGIQYRMIECMLRKNKHLLSIKDCSSYIPVTQAITRGHIKLACYLYPLTPLEDLMPEKGSHGATLCVQAIRARKFDIALELIQLCPRLALALDNEGCSPLYALASMPCAFPRGNRLVFWKRWIYSCVRIQSARATEEFRLNIQNGEERQSDQVKVKKSVLALLRQLVTNVFNLLGIKELYEMKFLHVQSRELLQCMCKEISSSNIEQMEKGLVYDTIFQAIKKDIFEFVCDIVRANPDLLRTCTDEYNRDIFSVAVLHRQAKIFSLIYGLDNEKNDLTFVRDMYGDEILQMAGMLATSTQLNRIPGAALQMQRELQWYKEVESIVFPKVLEALNKDRLKPRELFTKNHKELMKEGEKWMKDTATSCTVVGALIVTIMFAAAFAVPGGNEENIMFLNEKLVMLFIVSDSLSFFSSATSILMFLGILTSRYAEEDFLKSLPTKMIIGLSTLFLSIASMMIAFCAALELMLGRRQSWFFNPVICLASVPVTLFIVMQFPLLVDMVISTYGSGIFNRKMKHWF